MHLLEKVIKAGKETREDMKIVSEKLEENYRQSSYYDKKDRDFVELMLPFVRVRQFVSRVRGRNYLGLR